MLKTALEQGQSDALAALGLLKEAISTEFIRRAIRNKVRKTGRGDLEAWRKTLRQGHPDMQSGSAYRDAREALDLGALQKTKKSAPRAWDRASNDAPFYGDEVMLARNTLEPRNIEDAFDVFRGGLPRKAGGKWHVDPKEVPVSNVRAYGKDWPEYAVTE